MKKNNKKIFVTTISALATTTAIVPMISTISCTHGNNEIEVETQWNDDFSPFLCMYDSTGGGAHQAVDLPRAILSTDMNRNIDNYEMIFSGEHAVVIDATNSYMTPNDDGIGVDLHIAPSTQCAENLTVTIEIKDRDSNEVVLSKVIYTKSIGTRNMSNSSVEQVVSFDSTTGAFQSSNELFLVPSDQINTEYGSFYYALFYDANFNQIFDGTSPIVVKYGVHKTDDENYTAFGMKSDGVSALAALEEPTPMYVVVQFPDLSWEAHDWFTSLITFTPAA